MTLLLGPPGAGKTTLLKALAGKLQRSPDLKVLPVCDVWKVCCFSTELKCDVLVTSMGI